jgi:ligand-binding SRPBCC domain-containing protein
MPSFGSTLSLAAPPASVFALLRRPAVLSQLVPPEMHLKVESGPDELALGSRLALRGRRWGVPQRVVSEVVAFEPDSLLVLEQRQGPFRRWTHSQRLEAVGEGGTQLSEHVEYEPPGGVLGLTVTAAFLQKELSNLFAFRRKKLAALLSAFVSGPASGGR